MEEIDMYLDEARSQMQKAIEYTETEFMKIRAGKASPGMLKGLMVEYYGAMTPIEQVASINTLDARTIQIKPWEKTVLGAVETAIMNSDLGLNPQNDGDVVRLNIPPLTEERRKDLVKQTKSEAENGKVSIRNTRKEINTELKKLQKEGVAEDDIKRAEEKVQTLTDESISKIDDLLQKKESEIMTV